MFLVVNKAPANFVHPNTGAVLAVFPETGVYFAYDASDRDVMYDSSLALPAKSAIAPIPLEYVERLEATVKRLKTNVTKAQGMADAAQGMADAAQSTADAAQSTADAAQSTADTAKSLHYTLEEKNYHGVYDKKTEGRDTFVYNAFDYYRISNFVVTYGEIKRFSGTDANGTDRSTVISGENCVMCGRFIVVNATGKCSLTEVSSTMEFTAPSTGLYACYNGATNGMTAGSYDFTFNISAPIVTNPSTYKKYYITVDDTGMLKATEVT